MDCIDFLVGVVLQYVLPVYLSSFSWNDPPALLASTTVDAVEILRDSESYS